jgi:hypothetical protein
MKLTERIAKHREQLVRAAAESKFTVFLCGPTLDTRNPKPSAQLRATLKERLEQEGFDVALGED